MSNHTLQPQNLFVNYTHPDQQSDRQQRQKVASYIGTYYRNRSRPQTRRKTAQGSPAEPISQQVIDENQGHQQRQASGMQVLHWRLEQQSSSPLRVHDMHGLKVDPFKSYPIPYTENLPRALEYFLEAYGPTHVVRSHLSRCLPSKNFLQKYVQYAMQHASMFGSIITLAFATMRITTWKSGKPDLETSQHYGNTLASLRTALSTEKGLDEDATILAILALIRTEYLVGNVQAYRAHVSALKSLIEQRGGVDKVGWQDIIVPAVTGAIARAKFFLKIANAESCIPVNETDPPGLERLEPYKPTDISGRQLPPGLKVLEEESRISDTAVNLAKATLRNPAIDLRHNNVEVKNAYNTELTEHLEHLLNSKTLSLEDEILLISIHRELYDLASNERYSVLYKELVMYWTTRSLQIIDSVAQDDTPMVEMFVWTCFKHAGTMVAPFLNMMSEDTADPRFQLMVRIMEKFWQVRDWPYVEVLLMKFSSMRECLHWWYLIWRKVRTHCNLLPLD